MSDQSPEFERGGDLRNEGLQRIQNDFPDAIINTTDVEVDPLVRANLIQAGFDCAEIHFPNGNLHLIRYMIERTSQTEIVRKVQGYTQRGMIPWDCFAIAIGDIEQGTFDELWREVVDLQEKGALPDVSTD